MAARHRLNGQAYTCKNYRFWTDTTKGVAHGPGQVDGSVFASPLINSGAYTLWLEHVVDNSEGFNDPLWLMWYDDQGDPTIPLSGVFDKEQLKDVVARLSAFIEIK
ncbi:hypothetical protein MEX01_34320 [Methylorubrum extorquens]|nr:hypothetical protein MEX01_34320 [Methylorubrum extorquens]